MGWGKKQKRISYTCEGDVVCLGADVPGALQRYELAFTECFLNVALAYMNNIDKPLLGKLDPLSNAASWATYTALQACSSSQHTCISRPMPAHI